MITSNRFVLANVGAAIYVVFDILSNTLKIDNNFENMDLMHVLKSYAKAYVGTLVALFIFELPTEKIMSGTVPF